MKSEKKICAVTGDVYYKTVHDSGLTVYVCPKNDRVGCSAIFGTNYGSIDISFIPDKGAEKTKVPAGIAHYLEHKLFENDDSEVFELFARTGADANAYTTYDKTCYLFNCTEHFEENLEILLDFVQRPYFTAETVEKERGIIAQEIRMYEDNPEWQVFSRMTEAMYENHPIKLNVAGTVESINEIDADLLYTCYNTFYTPSNMVLSVSGNVTNEQVLEIVDRMVKKGDHMPDRCLPDEPDTVSAQYVESDFDVSTPLFCIGYKEKPDKLSEREIAATEILMEILGGKPSALFGRMLKNGLVNHNFDADFMYWQGAAMTVFSGESNDIDAVLREITQEIEFLKEHGISEEDFDWAKKTVYAQMVAQLENADNVANELADCHFAGEDMFAGLDAIPSLTVKDVQDRLRVMMDSMKRVVSIVKSKEEE